MLIDPDYYTTTDWHNAVIWNATTELRWYKGKLQQRWVEQNTGAVEWRDVPEVVDAN